MKTHIPGLRADTRSRKSTQIKSVRSGLTARASFRLVYCFGRMARASRHSNSQADFDPTRAEFVTLGFNDSLSDALRLNRFAECLDSTRVQVVATTIPTVGGPPNLHGLKYQIRHANVKSKVGFAAAISPATTGIFMDYQWIEHSYLEESESPLGYGAHWGLKLLRAFEMQSQLQVRSASRARLRYTSQLKA
jgi:hypothetical protein